jgi:glutathione S-transferase
MSINMPYDDARQPMIELLQFRYSIYNEKVRWALDWKGVPHLRHNLIPGPHAPAVKRLTGQTQVPVLRVGGSVIHGSARIIDELERRFPEPALYPADPGLRKRALDVQGWFDDAVGPQVRCALFASLLEAPDYVCAMFTADRSLPTRTAYRLVFPLVRRLMKRSMGITGAEAVERAVAGTGAALDFVAREAGPNGMLVGDAFSVADLTAASILAPTVRQFLSPTSLPEPRPPVVRRWLARWAGHPGVGWVVEQYRRHRAASATEGCRARTAPVATGAAWTASGAPVSDHRRLA